MNQCRDDGGDSSHARLREFGKRLALSLVIGILTGPVVVGFVRVITWCMNLFLGSWAGFVEPTSARPDVEIAHPWVLIFVMAGGGLLTGWLSARFTSEAPGQGFRIIFDEYRREGKIPPRVTFIKTLTAISTLGTGGSVGRGGPDALIGAGIGSWVAHRLFPDERAMKRFGIMLGVSAGIAAVFKAPLGGTLIGLEFLVAQGIAIESFFAALLAAFSSYGMFILFQGRVPIFGHVVTANVDFSLLLGYVLLGLVAGALSLLYPWLLAISESVFHMLTCRLPFAQILTPAFGGVAVALIGLVIPQAISIGFGWTQLALDGDITHLLGPLPSALAQVPVLALIVLMLAKLLTTSLTVGSGGSGGLLGPGFVMGSFIGLAFWSAGHALMPSTFVASASSGFVIVGMSAFIGIIARAPLAFAVIVLEMTGDLSFIVPTLLAMLAAKMIVGKAALFSVPVERVED